MHSQKHAPFLSSLRRAIESDRAELIKDLVRNGYTRKSTKSFSPYVHVT